uniref:Uncharacterized protein n=1 Tax=Graphocephala atropunctata TaxID=36148 RepID=A0A1B6KUD5_9HEMI
MERRIRHSKGLEKTVSINKQQIDTLKESMKYLKKECCLLKNTHKALRIFLKSTFSHELKNISHMKMYILQTTKQMEIYLDDKIKSEQQNQRDNLLLNALLDEKKNAIEDLETITFSFNKEIEKLHDHILALKLSITEKDQQLENVDELKMKIGSLEKTVEESKLREQLYKAKIESSGQPILQFSGDPLSDMENQRRINKKKIRDLLLENENLKTTIYKMKELDHSRASTPSSTLTSG